MVSNDIERHDGETVTAVRTSQPSIDYKPKNPAVSPDIKIFQPVADLEDFRFDNAVTAVVESTSNQTSEVQIMRVPFALLLMTVLTAPVLAAEAPARDSGNAAREGQPRVCHDDIQKFCGQVKPGEGRIIRCMKENQKNFSPACKTEMEKHRKQAAEKREEIHQVCKADAEKLCKNVEPGKGRVMRCLHEHEKELSEDCRESLPKRSPRGKRESSKPAG